MYYLFQKKKVQRENQKKAPLSAFLIIPYFQNFISDPFLLSLSSCLLRSQLVVPVLEQELL